MVWSYLEVDLRLRGEVATRRDVMDLLMSYRLVFSHL